MECPEQFELEAFLNGTLSGSEAPRFQVHIAQCDRCRRAMEAQRADHQLFGDLQRALRATQSIQPKAPPTVAAGAPAPESAFQPIEGYQIVSEIHRGGQGIVYKAVQKATKRIVALKVLLHGPHSSPQQRYRFEREVDLVASLQHPSIVTIYDSGVTSQGQHYFAMEYIHGLPLDLYLRTASLGMDDRLRLFQRIAQAVGHAHLRGVIHRDLKPSNVRIDSNGEAHILDFGLAKAAGAQLTREGPPVTLTGEFVGTLAYASPEHVKGDPKLIDVRTDVYSLGVMLYEMLTGKLPYSVDDRLDQVVRTITEVEPQRPTRLNSRISDELETIVLKALVKDPERRYHSATAFADDIGRLLCGEAIEAKRASSMYILSKAIGHYRRQIATGGAFGLVFVVVGAFGWRAWKDRENLKTADKLVNEARLLVEAHEQSSQALSWLDEAIHTYPRHEHAYVYRGILHVADGLKSKIDDRAIYVSKALADFRQAHLAAGGFWPASEELVEHHKRSMRGSRQALVCAAKLCELVGRMEDARTYATYVDGLRDCSPEFDTARTLLSPFYDLGKDPLVQTPRSKSPQQAYAEPDWEARIVRCLPAQVNNLNPLLAKSYAEHVTELLFDTLVVVDAQEEYKTNDALVESKQRSDGGSIATFTLKPGLVWSDGEPLTANDVVFSWEQLKVDHLARKAFSEVRAVDQHRVAFHLKDPAVEPDLDLTFPIISQDYFLRLQAEHPKASLHGIHEEYGRRPVSNGPYLLAEQSDERIVLERWDKYPGPKPYLKRVEFVMIPDRNKRIRALADHLIHQSGLTAWEFQWDVNGASFDQKTVKIRAEEWSYDFICWNTQRPLFSDRNVRRALTMAINLPAIISNRHTNLYSPCSGIYHPNAWMANREVIPLKFEPTQAARLLEETGWLRGSDGVRERAGQRFEFDLLVVETSSETLRTMGDIQADLRAAGIAMRIEPVPEEEWVDRREAKDFDAYVGSVTDAPHPDRSRQRWVANGSRNYGGYSNREVDDLYDRARKTKDLSRQRDCYREIHRIVYEDQPYTFLWHRPSLWAVDHRLRGVQVGDRGLVGFHPGPRAWWLATGDE